MKATLQAAILFAKDISALTRFYRDGLGLAVIDARATATWVPLDAGGVELGLHAIPDEIARDIAIATVRSVGLREDAQPDLLRNPSRLTAFASAPVPREDTPIKLVFAVADLEAARAHLIAHGASMQEPRWGGCDGCDPEGNVFRIATAP